MAQMVIKLYFKSKQSKEKDHICDYQRQGLGKEGIKIRQSKSSTSSYKVNSNA